MPYLEGAHNIEVNGSTLIDVQGTFNCFPNNGEGWESVIARKGIKTLFKAVADDAMHSAYARFPQPKCHPNTRTLIISRLNGWVTARRDAIHRSHWNARTSPTPDELDEMEIDKEYSDCREIVWLHGPAGAGKSAIAQTLAESCALENTLAASFFFTRGGDRRGTVRYFITTIAYLLAQAHAEWYDAIGKAVAKYPEIISQSLEQQLQKLVIEPLKSAASSGSSANEEQLTPHLPFLIVIDGLDECENDKDQCALLNYISEIVHTHHLPFTFLIASRPEPHIRHHFEHHTVLSTISHSLFLEESYEDIEAFLRDGFHQVRQGYHQNTMVIIDETWPSNNDILLLVDRSSGYFIYASTVLKFIDDSDTWPPDQLALVLSKSPEPFTELDNLYRQILRRIPDPHSLLLPILACIPGTLLVRDIEIALDLRKDMLRSILRRMHALLSFSSFLGLDGVDIVHASFRDFLGTKQRSGEFHLSSRVCRDTALRIIRPINQDRKPYIPSSVMPGTYLDNVLKGVTNKDDQDYILHTIEAIIDRLPSANLRISRKGQIRVYSKNEPRSFIHSHDTQEVAPFEEYAGGMNTDDRDHVLHKMEAIVKLPIVTRLLSQWHQLQESSKNELRSSVLGTHDMAAFEEYASWVELLCLAKVQFTHCHDHFTGTLCLSALFDEVMNRCIPWPPVTAGATSTKPGDDYGIAPALPEGNYSPACTSGCANAALALIRYHLSDRDVLLRPPSLGLVD